MYYFADCLALLHTKSLLHYHTAYSELPAFLVQDGGLNSGFMIAHCTAAALGNLKIELIVSG